MSHLGTNRDIFEKEVCLFPFLRSVNPQGVFSLPSASFLSHCAAFLQGTSKLSANAINSLFWKCEELKLRGKLEHSSYLGGEYGEIKM